MLINLYNLKHLPVITQSGVKLGKVYDINFDIETHCVKSYLVRHSVISQSYLIKPVQVVNITNDSIIVEDGLVKEKVEKKSETMRVPKVVPEIATRTED